MVTRYPTACALSACGPKKEEENNYSNTSNLLVPAQDVPYALILWYVAKIIYLL